MRRPYFAPHQPDPSGYDPSQRDYTCVATRDFAPLLRQALLWAARRDCVDGLQQQQPIAGTAYLAQASGVDDKTIIRIAKHEILLVELRTVDAILTAAGIQFDHDLVIPKSRQAAMRMAQDEADARPYPTHGDAIRFRAEELYQRYLRAIENPPTPFLERAERQRLKMRQRRLEQQLGRPATDSEVAALDLDEGGVEL